MLVLPWHCHWLPVRLWVQMQSCMRWKHRTQRIPIRSCHCLREKARRTWYWPYIGLCHILHLTCPHPKSFSNTRGLISTLTRVLWLICSRASCFSELWIFATMVAKSDLLTCLENVIKLRWVEFFIVFDSLTYMNVLNLRADVDSSDPTHQGFHSMR